MNNRSKGLKFFGVPVLMMLITSLWAGRYAGDFMEIGAGVRSLGMGGAYCAVADDGSAVYWNPAGLSQIRNVEISLMHAFLYDDLAAYDYVTYVQPLPNNVTIGLNWTRLSIDDIPYFDEKYLVGTTVDQRSLYPDLHLPGTTDDYFSSADDLLQFSFSKNIHHEIDLGWSYFELPADINFGGTIKYIKRDLQDHLGTGTGFDFGVQFKTDMAILFDIDWMGSMAVGANFKDVGGTTVTWDTDSEREDEILQHSKVGAAITQPLTDWNSTLIMACDLDYEYINYNHFGLEYQYGKSVAVRTGWYNQNFTGGVSLKFYSFTLDYAFVTNTLGNTNRVGVRFVY